MSLETVPGIFWGLLGLAPLLVYIILVFRNVDILAATVICVVIGAILSQQTLVSLGTALAGSMGSFLALVGLIIMLGRGLGEVLNATKVSHTIVHGIIYSIGVDTERKAMLGIMVACLVIVGLLGTMAGGNAIIAPIVLPIAAALGLSRSTVGVIFQAVGEEALILGPFSPPVITLLGLTNIGYGEMLLYVSGPVALITLAVTWLMIQRIQRNTRHLTPYEQPEELERFEPTRQNRHATLAFTVAFVVAVIYGIAVKAPTSFVVVIMLGLSFITGFTGGLRFEQILRHIIHGMAGNVGLFLLFLLLDPFIIFVEKAGGFAALTTLLKPMMESGGKSAIVITGGFLGAFGISGATVATLKLLHEMFNPLLAKYAVSMLAWSLALVVATRVHNFVFPGANMVSSLGFAESTDMKSMLRNGWLVAACQLTFLVLFSLFFA
ncbi:membrane protein [Geotalea daltonii FRC-32]|uniref:Membrane protein n=1 Tax=Geotalea daltonii (strain DSM 22248 / JCM 15807 / FRC-32) TaxID=316067 RepID=B9M999_GEODF|nr:permease [Geotalea daltonii]ACM18657.1 membrane protein [Geotalea daltonii FRC-32]